MDKTDKLERALQGLNEVSEFHADIRAMIIQKFNVLQSMVSEDKYLKPSELRELENLYGDFLISMGEDYKKEKKY